MRDQKTANWAPGGRGWSDHTLVGMSLLAKESSIYRRNNVPILQYTRKTSIVTSLPGSHPAFQSPLVAAFHTRSMQQNTGWGGWKRSYPTFTQNNLIIYMRLTRTSFYLHHLLSTDSGSFILPPGEGKSDTGAKSRQTRSIEALWRDSTSP